MDQRPLPPSQALNTKIRDYFAAARQPVSADSWLSRPEFPTSAEVMDLDGIPDDEGSDDGYLRENISMGSNRIEGAWDSKEHYLSTHYELLREDSVKPIREAVAQIKHLPLANEDEYQGTISVYERVYMTAVIFSTRGIALRVIFSLARAGKRIHWEQSKRLLQGSLVVLTPANDRFKTKAKTVVAVVAARPLAGVQQNPPEIDLFVGRTEEIHIDPQQEWIMIEERSSYFEADRYTLQALQKIMREPFPLSEHLVAVQSEVKPPVYVQDNPYMDLSSVFAASKESNHENVDIVRGWPTSVNTELDESQLAALRRILTKRLAIVQGPPGTGKTHVSSVAIKALVNNMASGDPPIVVACQTNHALDQLLRHVAVFEPDFIRLGGRSKDQDVVKNRTLYAVRESMKISPIAGCWKKPAIKRMKDLERTMTLLLSPLEAGKGPLDHKLFQSIGLLTPDQSDSLERGALEWVQHGNSSDNIKPIALWLGTGLVPVQRKQVPEEFGYEYEEVDLEFEQLKEMEAENRTKDDEDFETLSGNVVYLADNFTGRQVAGMTEGKIRKLLERPDLWKIPEKFRGAVYRYLQHQMKQTITAQFRQEAKKYSELAEQRKVGGWEQDVAILKQQKVIGLTTTGFSKYRPLISGLDPKIVMIEEAAETLEAPVIATCLPSLEHLILVGDHQQLRPHCHNKEYEDEPWNLNVSLFERLVKNEVEFSTLSRQRRMIPEIRRILKPIYGNLIKDHPSVEDSEVRPSVPGMGGVNSFFFSHAWPESRDNYMSSVNHKEAEMIVGFFDHLVYNGMQAKDITVLTFYNGQRKVLLNALRNHPNLQSSYFNVVTVDSYQGEENDVVLLSLVRSNSEGKIGFLSVENRVCVALSRAQRGLYIFGKQ
ncbi:hypothetical protein LTR04_001607 [Oleoguttula sp. CCFEE 6159]|nr:hypothetical protein LTR04_001607 [Oleoguttula sp. CCFEE 6159]